MRKKRENPADVTARAAGMAAPRINLASHERMSNALIEVLAKTGPRLTQAQEIVLRASCAVWAAYIEGETIEKAGRNQR